MNGNDFVKLALRSPLNSLLGNTMLITVTGRRTGRKISLPVNYQQQGNTLWVISSRDRTWWRNLLPGADVEVLLHGHVFTGYGEAIVAESAVAAQLAEYVRLTPGIARYIGLRLENGVPNAEDLERLAAQRLFVRICL